MGVTFKGGTSGCREDYAAPTPKSGESQPVLDTSTSAGTPDSVTFKAEEYKQAHAEHATPDFLPTGGTISTPTADGSMSYPSTTDVVDPTATQGGWGPGVRTSKAS